MNILLLDCCTNAVQILEKLQSYIRESQITNWQDTINVFIVCAAICFIVRYGVRRYFRYKTFESNKHEEFEKLKHTWEVDENNRKMEASAKEQAIEEKNRQYKKDLLNKKLEMLKEMSSGDDSNKINKEAAEKYIAAIDEALKK